MSAAERAAADSPAKAERDIERTRVEIAVTLDALDQKLSRYLLLKGRNMLHDTLGGSEGLNRGLNRGLDAVRANPIPIALIGLGAAWLLASNTGVVDRIAQDERVGAARRRVADMASDLGGRAGELASDVAGRVGIGGSGAERPLGQTGNPIVDEAGRDSSSGWTHQVSGMAQGAIRSVRESAIVNRVGNLTGDGAGRLADRFSDAFDNSPLVVGAVGLMAGALIAALLPATRIEDELLGSTRDELWSKAENAGQDAITRVHDAATHAIDSATEAAAARVGETATQAVEAATEAATDTLKADLKGRSQA